MLALYTGRHGSSLLLIAMNIFVLLLQNNMLSAGSSENHVNTKHQN